MGRYDLWNLLRGKANSSTEDKFAGGIAHEARFFDLWLIRSLLRASQLRGQIVSKDFMCMPGTAAPVNPADVKKRTEVGDMKPQFQYGFMLYMGRNDLDMNPVEAFKWFTLAGDRLPDATAKAELLKTGLYDKQIAEALTSAAELRSSFAR